MGLSGNLCLCSDVWDLGWEDRGGVWRGEQLGSVRLKSLRHLHSRVWWLVPAVGRDLSWAVSQHTYVGSLCVD